MDLSILFGQIFSVYMIVAAVAIFMRHKELMADMAQFVENKSQMFFFGAFVLLVGLVIVLQHNVWDGTWRSFISFVGWAAVVKGALAMVAPGLFASITRFFQHKAWYAIVGGAGALVLGVYLASQTFGM